MSEDQGQYKGEYKFDQNKFWNLNSGTTMEELPKELIDEEQLLQDKLMFWLEKGADLKLQLNEAISKVKFYEKAIKSYNKAFKK